MIDTLCCLCEEQNRIIRAMATRLGELGDTALIDELAAADRKYRETIGSEEWPGDAEEQARAAGYFDAEDS